MSKLTIGSQWKTRGGWRAIVVDISPSGVNPYRVYHSGSPNDVIYAFPDGSYSGKPYSKSTSDYDLIEPWVEPVVHEGWVNIYQEDIIRVGWMLFDTKDEAIASNAVSVAIACIKIKFTEGEGL